MSCTCCYEFIAMDVLWLKISGFSEK